MRNLKKTLSLCLAFVMLIGLMAVGAGAASFNEYTDKDTIAAERQEAVDLLTALGIIGGTEGGSFGPKESLQRDQAAKLVAWANLGIDANSQVSVNGNPFEDVTPASEWANAYMVYCKNMGFINGINAAQTEFAPLEPVSGYQLAKMLLCVVGYGVNKEYVGVNWSMKVAVDAQTTGLNKGIENISNEPISREDAAQMVFNALTMEMVAYSELYGTYSSEYHNALNPTLLGTKAEQVFKVRTMENTDLDGVDYHYWRKIGTTAAITNSYDCDNIVAKDLTDANAAAEMVKYDYTPGVEIWENGVSITARTYYLGDVKMEYYTTAPDGTCLYKPNFTSTSKPITYKGQRISLVDEGVKCKYDTVYETGTNSWWSSNSNNALNFWAGTGWGSSSTVRLQSNHTIPGGSNGALDKIIVTTSYLAKMTGAKTGTMYVPSKDQKTFSITIDNPSQEYKSGDFVLVTPNMTLSDVVSNTNSTKGTLKIIADEPAKSVDAANITSWSPNTSNRANGAVSTGGTNYSYNGVFANYESYNIDTNTTTKNTASALLNTAGAMPHEVKTLTTADKARGAYGEKYTRRTGDEYYNKGTYTLYLDQIGNVIGVEEKTAGIRDFAYIVEVGHDDFFYFTRVKALLSDGTMGTYYLDSSSDGYDDQGIGYNAGSNNNKEYPIGNETNLKDGVFVRPGEMYSYTLNGNYITLTDLDNSDRTSTPDNSTYDAVEDVYDIRGNASPYKVNATEKDKGSVERSLYVEAKAGNATQNAFTSGGTSFIYTVKNNTSGGMERNVVKNDLTNKKDSIWSPGTHVVYATDNTVFTYVYGGANQSTQIARYVGKNNAPTISATDNYSVSMVLRKTGNTYYIEYVVLRGTNSPNAVWSNNYFTIVGDTWFAEGKDVNGRTLYYYHVMKNGENVNLALTRPGLTNGDVCTYTTPDTSVFTGDTDSKWTIETGAYTPTKLKDGDGVFYDIFADVDATTMVIANKASDTNALGNRDINFAGARVWVIEDDKHPTSAREVHVGDPDYLRTTDTVTVVLYKENSTQQYYTAREIFITKRYDTVALENIKSGAVKIGGKQYVDVRGLTTGWDYSPVSVGVNDDLYIDGDIYGAGINFNVSGNLTISGKSNGARITITSTGTVEIKDNDPADTTGITGVSGATLILGNKTEAKTYYWDATSSNWAVRVETDITVPDSVLSQKLVVNTPSVNGTGVTGATVVSKDTGDVLKEATAGTQVNLRVSGAFKAGTWYNVTVNRGTTPISVVPTDANANLLEVPYTLTAQDIVRVGNTYAYSLAINVAETTISNITGSLVIAVNTALNQQLTASISRNELSGAADFKAEWSANMALIGNDYTLTITVTPDGTHRVPDGFQVQLIDATTGDAITTVPLGANGVGTYTWSTKIFAEPVVGAVKYRINDQEQTNYTATTTTIEDEEGVIGVTIDMGKTGPGSAEVPLTTNNDTAVLGNWIGFEVTQEAATSVKVCKAASLEELDTTTADTIVGHSAKFDYDVADEAKLGSILYMKVQFINASGASDWFTYHLLPAGLVPAPVAE